ncbi:monocarboxylate transporter 14-like isoform X3 [Dermacentor albipictus]|uniref:monocarboxylate transporter 14-like isoform X3 n=1 Tax=Dermacentor albipictus TaxID=60249 RepID=UPI0031FDCCE8
MPPPKEGPSTMANHYIISEEPPEFLYNGYLTEISVDHFSAGASRNNNKGQGELPTTTDKCWGVPLSLSGAAFLVSMPWSWFGLLLVFFVEKFGITREEASWPKSVATTITNISGLGVYGFQRYINTYHVVLLSTILTSVAFISAAFAPNMIWMTVTVGALHGFGHGIFLTASVIYTLQHFDKYRSVATSFIFISYGLSAIVSQFVLSGLVDAYALEGALLVFGAMVLNSTALVMLAKTPYPMRLGWTRSTVHLLQNGVHKPGHYGSTGNDNSTRPIRYVLTAEFVGVQRTAACSGIIGIVMVPAYLVSPKLVGIFRDASGSYDNYYRMLGALCLAAAVLFATYDACSRVPTERTKPAKDEGGLRYN